MVYYDRANERLVYINKNADENFWDEHWSLTGGEDQVKKKNRLVLNVTKKYLNPPSRVIDAGCGLAHSVFGLHHAGYEAYGIDFAAKTVDFVNKVAPELKVGIGDVRDMHQFADGFFDGYWSLGVIEHFFDGYEAIVAEMHRVIRPKGYAFVTVPSMSPLRRLKARMGFYPDFQGHNTGRFYQFALSSDSVINNFINAGFELIEISPQGGFKGLKDEIAILAKMMQKMYDSQNLLLRALRVVMDRVFSPLSSHMHLFIFRKNV